MDKKYLSMAQASEISPYEQDYLSLLARRGELQAEKIGRNWYTTIDWLNDYLKEKKPSDVIVPQKDSKPEMEEKIIKREKNIFQIVLLWMTFTAIMIGAIFWVYEKFALRLDAVEQKAQEKNFIPEEITQVPNEEGGYDVYGTGKMKLSE